jgi:ABC-type multidrug transport system fused ATPase/permease subunit
MKPIVVLDQGRILEEGTHHAPLAAKGLYSRLWEQQAYASLK